MTKLVVGVIAALLLLIPTVAAHGPEDVQPPMVRLDDYVDPTDNTVTYNPLIGGPDMVTLDLFETIDPVSGEAGIYMQLDSQEYVQWSGDRWIEFTFDVAGASYNFDLTTTDDGATFTSATFQNIEKLPGFDPGHAAKLGFFLPYSAIGDAGAGAVLENLLLTSYLDAATGTQESDYFPGGHALTGDPAAPTSYTLTGPQNAVEVSCDELDLVEGEPTTFNCTVEEFYVFHTGIDVIIASATDGIDLVPFTVTIPEGSVDAAFEMTLTADHGIEEFVLQAVASGPFGTVNEFELPIHVEQGLVIAGEGGGEFDTLELAPGESYAWKFHVDGHDHFGFHNHFFPNQVGEISIGEHGDEDGHDDMDAMDGMDAMENESMDGGHDEPVVHVIEIHEDGSFHPAELTIANGDVVQWVNTASIPMRAASNSAEGHEHHGHDHGDEDEGFLEKVGIPGPAPVLLLAGLALVAARRRS